VSKRSLSRWPTQEWWSASAALTFAKGSLRGTLEQRVG